MSLEGFMPNHEKAANAFMDEVKELFSTSYPDLNFTVNNLTVAKLVESDKLRKLTEKNPKLEGVHKLVSLVDDHFDIKSAQKTEVFVACWGKNIPIAERVFQEIKTLASQYNSKPDMEVLFTSRTGDKYGEILKITRKQEQAGVMSIYIFS